MTKHQLILPFVLSEHARFENFIAPQGSETVARLSGLHRDSVFAPVWLSGEDVGKSHLLHATCHRFSEQGRPVAYLPLSEVRDPEALRGFDNAGLLALDDVDAWFGDEELERALLALYQAVLAARGALLTASRTTPAQMVTHLPDLASRWRGMACYALAPLADEDKAQLVNQLAVAKGLRLSPEVLSYWMTHGSREVGQLLRDLDEVLAQTLQQRRAVTIPWLKTVLQL